MRKLISREYRDERDQQIVLLIDCGRRMAAQDDALSHFDHVLNAALLLAWVGVRTVLPVPEWPSNLLPYITLAWVLLAIPLLHLKPALRNAQINRLD